MDPERRQVVNTAVLLWLADPENIVNTARAFWLHPASVVGGQQVTSAEWHEVLRSLRGSGLIRGTDVWGRVGRPALTEDRGRQCVDLYVGDVAAWHAATEVGIQVTSGGDAQVASGNLDVTITQAGGDAHVTHSNDSTVMQIGAEPRSQWQRLGKRVLTTVLKPFFPFRSS